MGKSNQCCLANKTVIYSEYIYIYIYVYTHTGNRTGKSSYKARAKSYLAVGSPNFAMPFEVDLQLLESGVQLALFTIVGHTNEIK